MKNINTYLKEYLYDFKSKSFNELDALALTWLSYFHIPKELNNNESSLKIIDLYNAKYFEEMTFDVTDINNSLELLTRLAANPRFRDLNIYFYEENTSKENQKQFSAMTFDIGNDKHFVAYRGTDHSFVGWKEDLNMGYLKSIPSQEESKNYLNKVMQNTNGNIIVGGHSKGGNLAVFASCFIDNKYKKRIEAIYNFDGPNLRKEKAKTREYKSMSKNIIKFVPQGSVVGMIFETTNDYSIVKSNTIGVLQHTPFSWEVDKTKFKTIKDNSLDSKSFRVGLNSLVENLSEDELKLFANAIYGIVENAESDTVENLIKNANKDLPKIFSGIKNLTEDQKKVISKVTNLYIKNSFGNTIDTIKKTIKK